jgi:hypothetical protein
MEQFNVSTLPSTTKMISIMKQSTTSELISKERNINKILRSIGSTLGKSDAAFKEVFTSLELSQARAAYKEILTCIEYVIRTRNELKVGL